MVAIRRAMGAAAVIWNTGAHAHGRWRFLPRVMAFLLATAPGVLSSVQACWLEPTYNGGFMVSYPGALDVAVAVADSRRSGLLAPANSGTVSNKLLLQQMLADLRRLKSRLSEARGQGRGEGQAPFSLVLVGPGLWSHYYLTSVGVLARYHTDGPLSGKTVVLTHHSVLRALLSGDLSTARAAELGLIAYSGGEAELVQRVFDAGFQSTG